MDIEWLQRDFGIYVVNMFDTGQAARVLNFPRFSLAHLLKHYCDVDADKQYQLADWRIRWETCQEDVTEVFSNPRNMSQIPLHGGTHFLARWFRPLPAELIKYAREDTHYLLYIYDKMKNELLEQGNQQKNLLLSTIQRSTQLCGRVSDWQALCFHLVMPWVGSKKNPNK